MTCCGFSGLLLQRRLARTASSCSAACLRRMPTSTRSAIMSRPYLSRSHSAVHGCVPERVAVMQLCGRAAWEVGAPEQAITGRQARDACMSARHHWGGLPKPATYCSPARRADRQAPRPGGDLGETFHLATWPGHRDEELGGKDDSMPSLRTVRVSCIVPCTEAGVGACSRRTACRPRTCSACLGASPLPRAGCLSMPFCRSGPSLRWPARRCSPPPRQCRFKRLSHPSGDPCSINHPCAAEKRAVVLSGVLQGGCHLAACEKPKRCSELWASAMYATDCTRLHSMRSAFCEKIVR